MPDGRKGRKIPSHSYHTEAEFTEPYAERKARKTAPVEAGDGKTPRPRVGGRPMVIPPGGEAEQKLRRMWEEGALIKIIAEELDISEKAVKDARARLKLKMRRPNYGDGSTFKIWMDRDTAKLLREAIVRRSMTKAGYIRYLIRRDAGFKV